MTKLPIKTWSTPVAEEKTRLIPCAICGSRSFKPSLACEGFSYVRCAVCGLVQMNPQPEKAEIHRRYGARGDDTRGGEGTHGDGGNGGGGPASPAAKKSHGEEYLAYELANEDAFLNLALLALNDAGFHELDTSRARPDGKPRVLDIGCATGSLLAALRERGWETTGVEIGFSQAEYARHKRNLDVRSVPLEENNFPAGYFDAVLASHVIEHLNDPGAMVREAGRVLAPEGRFFVTTPNIAGFQARLFGGRWRSAIFDHLYLFSTKTLRRLLETNGFAVEKTATWGGLAAGSAPAPVKRFFDKAAKRLHLGDVMIQRARRG